MQTFMEQTWRGNHSPRPFYQQEEHLEALKEFEVTEGNQHELNHLVQCVHYVVSKKHHLDEELLSALGTCIPLQEEEEIDLQNLVKEQLKAALSLRRSYFSASGSLLDSSSAREAKDALASVQQVVAVLIKQQEGLDRQARLFKMENILIQCVEGLPEETKQQFLDEVARQLGD